MHRCLHRTALTLAFAVALCPAGFADADAVGPQDVKAVVGLITWVYQGYANGANDRKSFTDTVPWDIETGRLLGRIDRCQRKEGEVIDFDWPSDSQDPEIKDLSVVYSGSPSPRHATVRASFTSYSRQIAIDYDLYLYDVDQPRHWGVSNIQIHDEHGTQDFLKILHKYLSDECKGY